MNILVTPISFVLMVSSLVRAVNDIAGKRSILESLVAGINIPASGIDFGSGLAVQVPSQPIAVQVPHPVAVPVPYPIVVPVERPVPIAIDRPVPYPVSVIKKYFIPVPFKAMKTVPVIPVPTLATAGDSGTDYGGGSEITAESFGIYTNGLGRPGAASLTSRNTGATDSIDASSLSSEKSEKRSNSFRIHVKDT